ncbi:hypothetical protein MAHJHV47_46070 [Mycobacterium avium subsp. hominissuis]
MIAANRSLLMTLIATNILGQNTAAIAAASLAWVATCSARPAVVVAQAMKGAAAALIDVAAGPSQEPTVRPAIVEV